MFDLGDPVPLSFQIRDAAGALANATTVTLNITQPDGTVDGPHVLTPTTTGVYDYDFVPVQVGRHLARCVATGTNAAAFTDAFDVQPSDPGGIISLADAKAHLRVTQSTNDEELRLFIAATTSLIEHEVGPVLQATHVEVVDSDATIVLSKAPVIAVQSIIPTFTAPYPIAVPSYTLDTDAGILRQQPFMFADWGFDWAPGSTYGAASRSIRLTITYTAGRAIIPAPLQLAARIIVESLWESRRLAGPMPAQGDEPMPYGREVIPERAVELMAPYRRSPLVV